MKQTLEAIQHNLNLASELIHELKQTKEVASLKFNDVFGMTGLDGYLANSIQQHLTVIHSIDRIDILKCASYILTALKSGNKILICGNGGSAADAQHIAAEFVVKFKRFRAALPAIAINTDTSIITACGNDFSFNEIFSRQVDALGKDGDVLIAISTSGNSQNILNALEMAASKNILTIGFTGANGFKLLDSVDVEYRMKSEVTARIQEAYLMFLHLVCDVIDQTIEVK